MSQENVETVRRGMEAVARRDVDAVLAVTDPEVEFQTIFAPMEGIYRGHEGMRRYIADMRDAWEEFRVVMDSAAHIGDIVVAVGRITVRGRSGVLGETPVAWMFKFRNGKLLTVRVIRDPEAALEAVGLRAEDLKPGE